MQDIQTESIPTEKMVTSNHSPFDIVLHENESFHDLLLPEAASGSRMAIYHNAIRSLPLPPALWDSFQRACNKDASSQKLANIIKDDPVLSAAILRIANAPGLGVRIEITDVARAVSHLGMSLVRKQVHLACFMILEK